MSFNWWMANENAVHTHTHMCMNTHTMEYYSVVKKNEIMKFAGKQNYKILYWVRQSRPRKTNTCSLLLVELSSRPLDVKYIPGTINTRHSILNKMCPYSWAFEYLVPSLWHYASRTRRYGLDGIGKSLGRQALSFCLLFVSWLLFEV